METLRFGACYGNGDDGDDGTYITVTMEFTGTPLWATSRITETTVFTAGAASHAIWRHTFFETHLFGDTPFWKHLFRKHIFSKSHSFKTQLFRDPKTHPFTCTY